MRTTYTPLSERYSHAPSTRDADSLIAAFLLAMMVMDVLSSQVAAAQGGKIEVLPVQKPAPAAIAIETTGTEMELRRQMRVKNGVKGLHSGTVRFSNAPTGSFGFISPKLLGIALVTQSPDLAMEQVSPSVNAYEIHKLSDGGALLVGFVGKDLVPKLTPRNRLKSIRIALFSNPSEQAPLIVAVPLVKLMVDRMPIRIDPKRPDSPVMLDMDLQGTAKNTSPHMIK